jgi:hypothetical protein
MVTSKETTQVSVFRLRLGIFLFVLWWFPAYLMAPTISIALGDGTNPQTVLRIMIGIMIIQTAIGLLGVLLVGKTIVVILRHTKRKQVPKTVWHLFWTGSVE